MKIVKTPEQIERKYKKVYKRMRVLNDPKHYGGRELTRSELMELESVVAQWQILSWLTGKYRIEDV